MTANLVSLNKMASNAHYSAASWNDLPSREFNIQCDVLWLHQTAREWRWTYSCSSLEPISHDEIRSYGENNFLNKTQIPIFRTWQTFLLPHPTMRSLVHRLISSNHLKYSYVMLRICRRTTLTALTWGSVFLHRWSDVTNAKKEMVRRKWGAAVKRNPGALGRTSEE